MSHLLDEVAAYLTERSKEICTDNECTEEEHHCESYAYFNVKWHSSEDKVTDFKLVTVCCPDYLDRTVDIGLPLPFEGDGAALEKEFIRLAD